MFKPFRALALVLAVSAVTTAAANASVIYTYTGQAFTAITPSPGSAPADPYQAGDRVTGTFELAAPLPGNLPALTVITPVAFSFSDGVNTLTNATALTAAFGLSTDASGHILEWLVVVSANQTGPGATRRTISTRNYLNPNFQTAPAIDRGSDTLCGANSPPGGCESFDDGYLQAAENRNAPGTWTVEAVPEPTSMLLISAALAGLAARRRPR